MRNRVVITGLGVVAPNGTDKKTFWDSLVHGQSAIGPITLFDASQHPCRIAGEVRHFDLKHFWGSHIVTKHLSRQSQFALAAAKMAMTDASFNEEFIGKEKKIPLALGVSSSAMQIIEENVERLFNNGPDRVSPFGVQACQPHQAASALCEHLPFLSQASTYSSACAAGMDAIGAAMDIVRQGRSDIVLCGGTDAPITALTFASLARAGLVSLRNDTPSKASRPFDLDRDSGIISEGCGMLVLENLSHALARGVTPYMEITGYAMRMDHDFTLSGSGLAQTIADAIANAGRTIQDIDYICAHGPGHPVMDKNETATIKKVFGSLAHRIPISSIKGVIGNPLSAAGALQVIACALGMQFNIIPPTANLEKPDPHCDLDYVPLRARHARFNCALINVHGLGGGNSCLVVERIRPL